MPAGSRGLLITVDQGRERKASSEMLAVVEEVSHYTASCTTTTCIQTIL